MYLAGDSAPPGGGWLMLYTGALVGRSCDQPKKRDLQGSTLCYNSIQTTLVALTFFNFKRTCFCFNLLKKMA